MMTSFSFENLFSEEKTRRRQESSGLAATKTASNNNLPFSFQIQKFLNLKQVRHLSRKEKWSVRWKGLTVFVDAEHAAGVIKGDKKGRT